MGSETDGPVRTWRDGPVRIVRIDRPRVRNAVDHRTALALGAAWDLFERFLTPYARYRRFISRDLEPVFQDEEVGIVGIKSSRRATLELNWAFGAVGRRQLRRALRRLDALPPGLVRIVVVGQQRQKKARA